MVGGKGKGRKSDALCLSPNLAEAAIEQEGRAGGEESVNGQAKVGHQGRCSAAKRVTGQQSKGQARKRERSLRRTTLRDGRVLLERLLEPVDSDDLCKGEEDGSGSSEVESRVWEVYSRRNLSKPSLRQRKGNG